MPPHGWEWVPDANSDDAFAFVESLRWAGYCVDFQPAVPTATGTTTPAVSLAPSPGSLPALSTDFMGGETHHCVGETANNGPKDPVPASSPGRFSLLSLQTLPRRLYMIPEGDEAPPPG